MNARPATLTALDLQVITGGYYLSRHSHNTARVDSSTEIIHGVLNQWEYGFIDLVVIAS